MLFLSEQLEKISANQADDDYFKKPIITSYPRSFKVLDFEKGLFELNTGDKHTQVITYRKDSLFLKGSFSRQIGIPTKHNDITHAILMAAGCIFTKGLLLKKFLTIQIIIFMEKSFLWHCAHLLVATHFSIFLMCLYFIFIRILAIYPENFIGTQKMIKKERLNGLN